MSKYNSQYDLKYLGRPVYIQCTWVRVYTEPIVDYGLCIRSYDRKFIFTACRANFNGSKLPALTDPQYKQYLGLQHDITNNQIGELTGYYYIGEKNQLWLEARLLYCDRATTGWFRSYDVWTSVKLAEDTTKIPNQLDWAYIPYKPVVVPGSTITDPNWNSTTPKNDILAWLTAGAALLSFLH